MAEGEGEVYSMGVGVGVFMDTDVVTHGFGCAFVLLNASLI